MTSRFDRLMIEIEISSNLKIARLSDREFRCLVCGVWPVAAKATPRGYLAVAGQAATPDDIAHQARVPVTVARNTLALLRTLRMLELHAEVGLEYCHDWHEINPDPKVDATAAERQRRRRSRDGHGDVTPVVTRDSHANVTDETVTVTPPEVEGEEKRREESQLHVVAALPQSTENQTLDEQVNYLCSLMSTEVRASHGIEASSREATVVKSWRDACRAMLTQDDVTSKQIEYAVRFVCRHHYWRRRVKSMTRLRSEWGRVVAQIRADEGGGHSNGRRSSVSDLQSKLREREGSWQQT